MVKRKKHQHEAIGAYIKSEAEKTLAAYRSQQNLVLEHANLEEDTARGGYAHRQLLELVQNSADALFLAGGGRIVIRLTASHLYCADDGSPIDENGVRALMFSHLSSKRGTSEIGRFGLGFKSVLGVTDAPEFFSRSGSFRFDRAGAAERIRPLAPDEARYPVLRLPEAIDPCPEMEADPILRELMGWAVNVVRLPLKPDAHADLAEQISNFPPRFLLFVPHVHHLTLQTGEREEDEDHTRIFELSHEDGMYLLDDGQRKTRWMIFKRTHKLSPDARSDSRALDDADQVPITWAAPLDGLSRPGHFWAFFPTLTASLLAGILNAPWKTNEDRQNLLPGVYNKELIDAAAAMVAENLPQLSTGDDPARHLDAMPRRQEGGDNQHSDRLRERLFTALSGRAVVPDQEGKLRKIREISYPPRKLTSSRQIDMAPFERWAAYDKRPSGWLHHNAVTRTRLPTIDRLFEADRVANPQWRSPAEEYHPYGSAGHQAPRKTIAHWLEALVKEAHTGNDAVQASMAAIQTAALIPSDIRDGQQLGNIVRTAAGSWRAPDPESVYLGGGVASSVVSLVHPQLEADHETRDALRELGIRPASSESVFREYVSDLLNRVHEHSDVSRYERDFDWRKFWELARDVEQSAAVKIIQSHDDWRAYLRVRTLAGSWLPLARTLLPGPIVPADGSRDGEIAIDIQFHQAERALLQVLGAVSAPRTVEGKSLDVYRHFLDECRDEYYQRLPQGPQPHRLYLDFDSVKTSGPLKVLELLSEEGKAHYTAVLLNLTATYNNWTMRHDTRRNDYPVVSFKSPVLVELYVHGRIRTDDGIRELAAGLGSIPTDWPLAKHAGFGERSKPDPNVLRWLLDHPQAKLICQAFGIQALSDAAIEPIGEDDPIPLLDVWPGLESQLSPRQRSLRLIRSDWIAGPDGVALGMDCIIRDGSVYLERKDDEVRELSAVLRELRLDGSVAADSPIPDPQRDHPIAGRCPPPTDGRGTPPSRRRRDQAARPVAGESAGHT